MFEKYLLYLLLFGSSELEELKGTKGLEMKKKTTDWRLGLLYTFYKIYYNKNFRVFSSSDFHFWSFPLNSPSFKKQ